MQPQYRCCASTSSCLHHLSTGATPIPTNDMWVAAATGLEHGLAVYTRDLRFTSVPGLLVLGVDKG
jgi:predicted nucleic acid-binding protein